jgi:hypothetical protein
MSRYWLFILLLATGVVLADDVPEAESVADSVETHARDEVPEADPVADAEGTEAPEKQGAKLISGMSILGNQEAPKSLVIVPWKSSGIGESLGISAMLDDSRQPVDKEVFMRALSYYEIRSESTP